MTSDPPNIYLDQDDLAKRFEATLAFGRKHYTHDPTRSTSWIQAQPQREAAFRAATKLLPQSYVRVLENAHSGYYGSMNPLVFAMGWTRGPPSNDADAATPNPPPSTQLDLGCPNYGDEYAHISEMHRLGTGVVRGLSTVDRRLATWAAKEIEHAGASSVMFANVTPYQAAAGDDPVEEDWTEFEPMFTRTFNAARPLLLVAVGRTVTHRFCEPALPGIHRLLKKDFPRDAPGGKTYQRRWGLIDVRGLPTGYLELPVHPSLGYYAPYRESVARIAGELATQAWEARRKAK